MRLVRLLAAALSVSEEEAAAAVAYHAGQMRAAGVLLAVILAVALAATWAHSGGSIIPGPQTAPTPVVDFRP